MLQRLPIRGFYLAACVGLFGSGLALWAFQTTGAQAPSAEVDPEARQLLDEVAQVYQGLSGYSDEGSFLFSLKINDELQEETTDLKVAFERPNKLAMESDGVRVASDGQSLVTSQESVKKYLKQEAPERISLATILTGPLGAMLAGSPVQVPALVLLGMLVDEKPVDRLIEGAKVVRLGDDRELDGQTMKTIWIEPDQGPEILLLIDPETRLLQRIELIVEGEDLQAKAPPKTTISDLKIVWSSGQVQTESPGAEAFAFVPPEGFEEVKAAEPAAGGQTGQNPLLGQPSPDFQFDRIEADGFQKVSRDDLKGQVVLLDFWATWCPPCRKELPEIRDLANRLAQGEDAEKVAVIAVSEDRGDDKDEVRALVEKTLKELDVAGLLQGPVGRVALDFDASVAEAFGVEGLPTIVLLDAKGTVQAVHVGYNEGIGETLEEEIRALLSGQSLNEAEEEVVQ